MTSYESLPMASSASAPSRPLAKQVAALQELDRRECCADPAVFMERHCSIEEPDGTVIPLTLWGFQRDTIQAIHQDKAIIVLKARRLGLSWIILAYALWLALFHQGIRILVLCKTEGDASELLDRIRRMRDRIAEDPTAAHLLANLKQPAKARDAVTTLDVGQSTIRALVGTEQAARSETAGLVVLDEFAFQRSAAGIWRAILPTIEGGGRLAVISTGNGSATTASHGAEFASQWSRASSGESNLTPLFFPWNSRPDRDEAWKQRTLAALGDPERFATEYPETPDDAFTSPDSIFVYDQAGVDAAVRLGGLFDQARREDRLPPPVSMALQLGIDWGLGSTHMLPIWELPGGGIYVPPGEVVSSRGEPSELTHRALEMAAHYDHPLSEARYDAAGGQQMNTFASIAPETVGLFGVSFSKRKKQTVGFLRELFRRTGQGKDHRIIAISPENHVLVAQLRGLQQDERGEIIKKNDHGPDALIAGASPVAALYPSIDPADEAALAAASN